MTYHEVVHLENVNCGERDSGPWMEAGVKEIWDEKFRSNWIPMFCVVGFWTFFRGTDM